MKIAIISDIHGNADALLSVIEDINLKVITSVVILGDVVFKGRDPMKCFKLLKNLNTIAWVRGNTDEWLNEIDDGFVPSGEMEERIYAEYLYAMDKLSNDAIEFLKVLPEKEIINIEGKSILCVHGSDRQINEAIGAMTPEKEIDLLFSRVEEDILICGHTHTPYVRSSNNKLVMNVGSVAYPKDGDKATYGIIDIDEEKIEYSIRKVPIRLKA